MQGTGVDVEVFSYSFLKWQMQLHHGRLIVFFEPDQAFRGTTVGSGLMKFCLKL